jgi:hypothetical protein
MAIPFLITCMEARNTFSFIGGGSRGKPEKTTDLLQVTDKFMT